VFEKEELHQIKLAQQPELKLLGFKPRDFLQDYYCIKPSMFMIADETLIAGSTVFLGKLIERLEKKDMVAVCTLVIRKNSALQIVALLPQVGTQAHPRSPMGFHIIILPFADDIRDIPAPAVDTMEETHLEMMESIIEPLIASFNPNQIENPSLAKQYAYLHAMAMELEDIDTVDESKPNYDLIVQKSGPMVQKFVHATKELAPPAPEVVKPVKQAKRKVEQTSDMDIISEEQIKEAIKGNLLKSFTVAQLTDMVKSKGEKVNSKKKANLMEQVVELYT
jgi:ATP-dependent DNA helicase 2 subunit 1